MSAFDDQPALSPARVTEQVAVAQARPADAVEFLEETPTDPGALKDHASDQGQAAGYDAIADEAEASGLPGFAPQTAFEAPAAIDGIAETEDVAIATAVPEATASTGEVLVTSPQGAEGDDAARTVGDDAAFFVGDDWLHSTGSSIAPETDQAVAIDWATNLPASEHSTFQQTADDETPLLDDELEHGIASVFAALHSAAQRHERGDADDPDNAPGEAEDGITFRLLGELDRLWHRAA